MVTAYTTKKWTEEYKVYNVNVELGHWFWGPQDKLDIIAQGEKGLMQFKVLLSVASINYNDQIEPKLTLHMRTIEGEYIPAYLQPWQPYKYDKIIKAEFELPNGCFNFLLLGDLGNFE